MKTLVIIKTGQTDTGIKARHGDFEDWFHSALIHPELSLSVTCPVTGEALPEHPDGIVITGSPAMVSDREPWSERTAVWLRRAVVAEIPVLGVCYGHQLLAHAFGGDVGYHPQGREMGTLPVRLLKAAGDDRLFRGLPPSFPAHLTHRQSVLSLPAGAIRLACSDHEQNQAFRFGVNAWGVQFHPEFSDEVMRAYIKRLETDLTAEGFSTQALMSAVQATPYASELLSRFARIVAEQ